MDIKITNQVYKKEDITEMMEHILSIIENKFRPGWDATLTISFDHCQGLYHTDPTKDDGNS